jgi:hypothetical protein
VSAAASAEIVFLDARRLAALLARRELSAVEVLDAFLGQVERLNDRVNAIVTLRLPEDLSLMAVVDRKLAAGEAIALHGLPIAIKDLSLTKGLRTTFGSRIYRSFVPTSDELYVERIKRAGAIVIGKTNTPEFGAGSQTFNAVFGATRNPYDVTKTCGGSSGGAAVALACAAAACRRHGSRRFAAQPRASQRRRLQATPPRAAPERARRRHAWGTAHGAASTISRCCCRSWPAPTRAIRYRCPSPDVFRRSRDFAARIA